MNRIDRLFGILILLQSKKYVPAEKIAAKFHISTRTVYRDIKALNEQGIPISFEQHKGYFIVQGYFLPPISFSTEEANALLLMERFVHKLADKSIHDHYSNALSKVKAVLRPRQKHYLEFLDDHILLQMPAEIKSDFEHLSVLQKAISEKQIVELVYKKNKDESTCRKIEAIGLVFYAFSWHVIAWCHLRNDYRDFKVSRIFSLKNCELPFTKNDHIALNDYLKQLPVDY